MCMGTIKRATKIEIRVNEKVEIVDKNVDTFFEKTVTKFGSGAKIDCPKEHLGKQAYIIIRKK